MDEEPQRQKFFLSPLTIAKTAVFVRVGLVSLVIIDSSFMSFNSQA